uniref:RRM domain-containing protein n=1 Tax=Sinocyclocheilus anshuiensis TaxID=1608454 RepID=A0A671N6J3_9TELE
MADAEPTLDLTDTKHEESGDSPADEGEAEPQQTQENTNGVKTPVRERSAFTERKKRVYFSSYQLVFIIVVEFKDEEFVKKAIEVMSKHDLNGRPLNIKEDPDGEHARRVLQRSGRMYGAGRGQDIPPSIANNPNIPPEIISALQAGRLGTTVFVANLDFKVGWKKLKEVFSMAGMVRRADVKEDQDGKSRGMGTVTFEQPLEAVQAISMFNGQMLFDRQMHVKMDDKSLPPDDFRPAEKAPQLPRGLGGVGMGLGPGGQPINANRLSGGAVGSMGPGDVYRSGMAGMDRDFGRSDMGMNRPFGDSFGGLGGGYAGMGNAGMGPMGSGLGHTQNHIHIERERERECVCVCVCVTEVCLMRIVSVCVSPQLSYDLTWQKLKEKFSHCGQVMYAEIKMENGKSKGCGTVRFDSPESAEKACHMMNGTKINGREVDVRIDRNA